MKRGKKYVRKIERGRHTGENIYILYFAGRLREIIIAIDTCGGKVFWRRLTVVSIFGTFQIVKR